MQASFTAAILLLRHSFDAEITIHVNVGQSQREKCQLEDSSFFKCDSKPEPTL
jgi:hypothetical protein